MPKKPDSFDYTKKAAELEQLLARMQDPGIQIDEATRLHASGLELVDEIESYLRTAENKIRKHIAEE